MALQRLAGNRAVSGLGGSSTVSKEAPSGGPVASSDVVADERLEAEAEAASRPEGKGVGGVSPGKPPSQAVSPPSAPEPDGRYDRTSGINAPTGPNPAPAAGLSAPANGWNDQLFTPQAAVDVNRFEGKNAPGGSLPAVWQLRQGFHAFGWNGVRSPVEFDNGCHIRYLIQVGANFFFRTEHQFPGGKVVAPLNPYAAVNPLIRLTASLGRPTRRRRSAALPRTASRPATPPW